MSDEQVLLELDARGASAAAGLRAYVDGLDLATTPPRRSRPRRGLLAAATLLVIALAAAAVWVARSDEGPKVKTVDHPSPLYLFPDHVPDGVPFRGSLDIGGSAGGIGPLGPAEVYATRDRADVLVTFTAKLGSGQITFPGGHPITVDGRPGTTSSAGNFRGVAFRSDADRVLSIAGRGPIADDIVHLAEHATTRADQVEFTDGVLPDDLERLGAVPLDRLALGTFFAGVGGLGEGRSLTWASEDAARSVVVVVQEAGPIDEQVLGLLDREVRHTSVAGHDAVVSRTAAQSNVDSRAVAWVQDGHLVRVVTRGYDAQEAVAVARSLHEISLAEYDRRAARVELPPGTRTIASGGEGAGRWQVSRDAGQNLCIDRGGDTSCDGPVDVGFIEVNDDARPTLVVGTGPPGSNVDVLDGSRSLLAADPLELDDDGLVYFAAEVPEGVTSVDVTVDDGQGTDRRTVRTDHGSISSTGGAGATTTSIP
ncbi:MAG: hypothetical protein JO291_15305 [Acidimicrobiia bacterium]|nr:hypothetical protein [Acidimicrobiia bacterium]